jgi:hypothetical protein
MNHTRKLGVSFGAILLTSARLFAQDANEDARFQAGDAAVGDRFGFDVALDGERALIGVIFDDQPSKIDAGSARILERQVSGAWTQVANLLAFDAFAGDQFGYSVALDGDRAIVGSPQDDDKGSASGSAYVFERQSGGSWVLASKLVAADGAIGDFFGRAVAIDGDRVMVGSVLDDDGAGNAGSVYVYERSIGGTWSFVQKLVAPSPEADARFGVELALDGDRAAIGATLDDEAALDGGEVYVFEHGFGGWSEVAELVAPDAAPSDEFGEALALVGDRLIVGVRKDDDGAIDAGSARVFERGAGGVWSEVAALRASAPVAGVLLGSSVALEGERAVVGATSEGSLPAAAGRALLFTRESATVWHETAVLAPSVGSNGALFGQAAALSNGRALISADQDDVGATNAGAAMVFEIGSLLHGAPTISLASGGASALLVRAGPARAGDLYVMFGSLAGTSPGTVEPVSGLTLPLVYDAYTAFLIANWGGGLVAPWFGLLDAHGAANAVFAVPAGTNASFAGITVHHAALLVDLSSFLAVEATNAAAVKLVP